MPDDASLSVEIPGSDGGIRDLATAFRRGAFTMILYEIGFRILITALGVPIATWVIGRLVARSGSPAVSNSDLVGFLSTPWGLATAILLAIGYLVGQLVLSAGLMALAAIALAGRRLRVEVGLRVALVSSLRLLRMGALQLVGFAWVFAPFLGAAGLTYGFLLTGHDINYYLAEKPPAFLVAVGIGALLAVLLLARVSILYVQGLFALPGLIFEGLSFREAMKRSRKRIAGRWRRIGAIILGWHALVAGITPLIGLAFTAMALRSLDAGGTRAVFSYLSELAYCCSRDG